MEKENDLIKRLGALLKELNPTVESKADKNGLSVTLHFGTSDLERNKMRALAQMMADSAV